MGVEIEDIKRLRLEPGDRLVVYSKEAMHPARAKMLREHMAEWLDISKDRIAVLPEDLSLGVLSKTEDGCAIKMDERMADECCGP